MGHCQPARHNNRQLTAYEKVLLFSGLTIAGSCGELGELVSEGLIIRLSGVRVPVGYHSNQCATELSRSDSAFFFLPHISDRK